MIDIISRIINLIIKNIHRLFPVFGFILLSLYIWGRYIRNRLPREIPFDLTLLRLIMLIIICSSYIYIIYRLIKPKVPPQFILNVLVSIINTVKSFDNYTKQFNLISNTYIKIFTYIANKINYYNVILWEKILLIINTVPHIILLSALFIDTFYLGKLFYFYKVIWVTLFFFLIPFSLYSFDYVCEHYINYWEKNSENVWTTYKPNVLPPELDFWHPDYNEDDDDECIPPNDMEISFRTFIPTYFDEIYYEQKTPHFYYIIRPTIEWYNNLFKEYNVTWKSCGDIKNTIIEKDLNLIIRLKSIITTHEIITKWTNVQQNIKNIRIIIYIGYLICWAYILYVSLSNFKDFYMLSCIIEVIKTHLLQGKVPLKLCIFLLIIIFYNEKEQKDN
uniref:Uncharacterized protein n=1 Tax=Physarum polycephalum TaxID=5791 RepID=Q9MJ75_PHYPO|nr:hypothetical protein PhpooMp08 [Physarum polycephalum]BAB08087.1 unnamed protein product [Physarum polycephalum]